MWSKVLAFPENNGWSEQEMNFLPAQSYFGLAGDLQQLCNVVQNKVTAGTTFSIPVWQDYLAFIDEGYMLV